MQILLPFVTIEYTKSGIEGTTEKLTYDYLINATGPKLKFEATKGLGPENNSLSVCTAGHAAQTSSALDEIVKAMKKGEKKKFLIGTRAWQLPVQGAAFEYLFNIEYELRRRGVRDKAEITWISNEQELGDFGIGGMHLKKGGYITHSKVFTESLYSERRIEWITRAHVNEVKKDQIHYETLDGKYFDETFDFAMLLPLFRCWNKSF